MKDINYWSQKKVHNYLESKKNLFELEIHPAPSNLKNFRIYMKRFTVKNNQSYKSKLINGALKINIWSN